MRCLRPHEASALKSLGKETQPIATPPQDLHPIPGLAPKDEQLPGEGILGKLRLHQCGESIEALAQVSRAGRKPHLHARRQCDHCRRRALSTRFNSSASTAPCSRTRMPPANSISMTPRSRVANGAFGTELTFTVGSNVGLSSFTGRSGVLSALSARSRLRCASRRQPKTMLALIPCARATSAIDARGLRVSSRIRSFSVPRYLRRGPVRRPRRSVLLTTEVPT